MIHLLLIFGVVTFLFFNCSPGSSETGNAFTISGSITTPSCKHTAFVQLIPEHFNPFTSDSTLMIYKTTADKNGDYIFDSIPQGIYYLGAVDSSMQYSLLKGPFEISNNSVVMGTDTLKKTSTVIVSIVSDSLSKKPVGIFVKGTTCLSYVHDTTRYVNLPNVPCGSIDIMQSTINKKTEIFVENVTVQPEETVTVSYKNRPPVITSEKPYNQLFDPDSVYVETVKAIDPDGDQIRFSVILGPASLAIDSISGKIKWNATVDTTTKSYLISIRVTDTHGLSSSVEWTIENRITSLTPTPVSPIGTVICTLDSTYRYTIDTCQCLSQLPQYRFSWGDGDSSQWSTYPYASHTWTRIGTFSLRAQAKCNDFREESVYSDPINISVTKNE